MKLFILLSIFGACHAQVLIGGPCLQDPDCYGQPNSFCNTEVTGRCTCKLNYVAKQDLKDCLPIVNDFGGTCTEPQQCTQGTLGSYSDCIGGHCVCAEDSAHLPGLDKCLPSAELIGDDCLEDAQCMANLGSEAVCTAEGKCACNDVTSLPNGDGNKCLPFLQNFEDACEVDEQCTKGSPGPFSRCNAKCSCTQGALPAPDINKCLKPAGMDETCEHDIQCEATLGALGACLKSGPTGVCGCKAAGIPTPTKCLAAVNELGGTCEDPRQCQAGIPGEFSNCVGGKCACTNVAVPNVNQCLLKATLIGDPCQILEQCTANLGGSECTAGTCTCVDGTVEGSDHTKCLPGPLPIDEPCEDHNQCPANAVCYELVKCTCNLEYVSSGDKERCLRIVHVLGRACEEVQQCTAGRPGLHSECSGTDDKTCKCVPDAFNLPEDNVCYVKATLVGQPCVTQAHCGDLPNTECKNNACLCLANFKPNPGNNGCDPVAPLKGRRHS